MSQLKIIFKRILVLLIIISTVFSNNITKTEAVSHIELEINSLEKVKNNILSDVGLTREDLKANKKTANISKELSELIPAKVEKYAKKRASSLIETVKNNPEDFGLIIEKKANLQLGKPFVIYSAESLGKQDPIYYYPIIKNDDIILVLYVIECNGNYTAGISTDYASILNGLNYQNNSDYIFYEDGKSLYAENNDTTKSLCDMQKSDNTLNNKEKLNVEVFEDLPAENKVEAILNSFSEQDEFNTTPKKDMLEGSQGFSTKQGFVVRLNTSGCLVPQYRDNTCWAASVATTLRYLNYSKYKSLTARNVCDKISKTYSEGGNICDKQKALKKYGVTYSKLDYSQASFATVSKNILAQKPILASAFAKKGAHSITIIGYTTYGGINQITFHNSGTNSCTSVEYKKSGTTFSYNNKKYTWEYTLRNK